MLKNTKKSEFLGIKWRVFRQSDVWRYVRVAEFRGLRPVRQDKDASEKFATKLL
jgi:hypothetical protein